MYVCKGMVNIHFEVTKRKKCKKMQVNSCTTSTQKHQNIQNVTKMSCTQMAEISFP